MAEESTIAFTTLGWDELAAPESPWLSIVVGDQRQLDRFVRACPLEQIVVRVLPGDGLDDDNALLQRWSEVFDFPSTSTNWNSFIDWMRDLSWVVATQYVVFVTNANKVLPDLDAFRGFVDVLAILALDGVRSLGTFPPQFPPGRLRFCFQVDPDEQPQLRLRLLRAGRAVPRYQLPRQD